MHKSKIISTLHAWKLANSDNTSPPLSKGHDDLKLPDPSESGYCTVRNK